jgi:hypothetical protein
VKLLPVAGVLVAVSVALAGFGAYEYSQFAYESGVANGLSTQVSSLSGDNSDLQAQLAQARANLTTLTALRDSLLAQVAQASANSASLQNQIGVLDGQITQLRSQISNDESLLSLSVTNTLLSSATFDLQALGSTSTTFPFDSVSTPRSWGDVGVVVTGQPPSPPRVSQTGSQDCVFVTTCTVSLNRSVAAGDILLIFVSGYSPNPGWRAKSVNDSFGTSFNLYNAANWQASTNTYLDYVYYGFATPTSSPESVTVTYSLEAQHSDPIVMDVTGSGLAMYNGVSAVCTSSCSSRITTSPATLAGSYVAAANAYDDLGQGASAAPGWTEVTTGASVSPGVSFMTGEYTTNLGGGSCGVIPLLPASYVAKYPGYLSVTGTSSTNATLLVTYPGTTPTTATYPLGTSVSLTIPVVPGNVIVQLQNCGSTPFSATLTVKEIY